MKRQNINTKLKAKGKTRDQKHVGAEARNVYDAIAEMGRRDAGFDLYMSGRSVMLASPRAGNDLSATAILDQRCIGSPTVAQSVAADVMGTVAHASSGSTTDGALVSSATNAAVLATFGRAVVAQTFNGISEQSTLDEHATVLARDASSPQWTFAPGIVPVEGLDPGGIAPGDTVGYSFDAGVGLQEASLRIASVEVSLNEGRESMAIGFI
jgi:hypothetical protein